MRPTDLATAVALRGPYRAGGVDVGHAAVVDLGGLTALRGIDADGDGLTIGALTTLGELERSPLALAAQPALVAAAAAIANPNVRALATVGGNLLQSHRCAYLAASAADCLRAGGTGCPARTGWQEHAVCFDSVTCVAPHPSTLATALTCLGAVIHRDHGVSVAVSELTTTGLGPGEVLTAVTVPPLAPGETSHYLRIAARTRSDWPLVEVAARLRVTRGVVTDVVLVAGAVAPTPRRLTAVEERLTGRAATPAAFRAAAELASAEANPLPGTGYKTHMLKAAVADALTACHPG